MDCIFCKIVRKEVPSEVIEENEHFIVFKDIHPKAPIHWLIVPKKHIASVNELTDNDPDIAATLILLARDLAIQHGLRDKGYKLVFNVGRGGGQLVDHLHLHLLSGWDEKPDGFAV